ncbi:PD-(D/E)XK nuclease family protein, partial [Arthrobacter sp. H5]|uniref:ATP-dependent helicase n=1 Tax=Arthrobacter sp. H5 TaxID=1267973 RepID=UPI0009E070E8
MTPQLRLPSRAEGSTAQFVPSPDQERILELGSGCGPVLVLGGPGTGKTTVLIEAAVRRISSGSLHPREILMITPSRVSAARLRDNLTSRLDRSLSAAPARTWSSYAFDLVRRARIHGLLPHLDRAPRLLSGAEQDLIIRELLDGHRRGMSRRPNWPENLSLALGTRGFRQEIRELFDRVSEYGAHAEELAAFGDRFDRADWQAAAALYSEYRDVLDLRMPEAFDPAGILTAARSILELHPDFLAEEQVRHRLVLVDDYQEANIGVHALLSLLVRKNDLIVTSCPDTVVQGFRGARPELTARLGQLWDVHPTRTMLLTTSHRLPAPLASAWQNVASRISVAGAAPAQRQLTPANLGDSHAKVSAHVVDSSFHELRYVLQRILEAHVGQGRSLDDVAVIVRTGAQAAEIQRYLVGQGVPVNVPAGEKAIRDEPAVRPLLEILALVLGDSAVDADLVVSLLGSRVGAAGTLEIRRLRQALRRREVESGGSRSSDELLIEAFQQPDKIPGPREARPIRRLAAAIHAGGAALKEPGSNPESVLWAIWSALGLSDRWAAAAVAEGPGSARADRDLDAVVALFQTAERFVDQMPGAPAALFLEYLTNQELPMDTLAPRAQKAGSVAVMTPASAAGREWPVVIVAGIQEGVWPNLRLRGELLGSGELASLMDHGPDFRQYRDPLSLMRETRFDELRSFSTAVSRAGSELICCAVASDDQQPSPFLDLIDPLPDGVLERARTEVNRPLTLRALVAELRKFAQQPDAYPEWSREAAHHLGTMVNHPITVPGAAPDTWWGLGPLSSALPVVPEDQVIPVSPSKVDAVMRSPLNWFVSAAGGERPTDFARSLGTLVHSIAQELPDATGSEYLKELLRRWPALGMKDNWEGRIDFKRAEGMVRKLARYVVAMRQDGRSLVATEVDFSVDLPVTVENCRRYARLRGQIDRLEIDEAGRLHIVDLKTGKSSVSKEDVPFHPQLAAYQVAVNAGALAETPQGAAPATGESGGASLVQLGTQTKDAPIQQQPAVEPVDTWALDMLGEAAGLMSGSDFDSV